LNNKENTFKIVKELETLKVQMVKIFEKEDKVIQPPSKRNGETFGQTCQSGVSEDAILTPLLQLLNCAYQFDPTRPDGKEARKQLMNVNKGVNDSLLDALGYLATSIAKTSLDVEQCLMYSKKFLAHSDDQVAPTWTYKMLRIGLLDMCTADFPIISSKKDPKTVPMLENMATEKKITPMALPMDTAHVNLIDQTSIAVVSSKVPESAAQGNFSSPSDFFYGETSVHPTDSSVRVEQLTQQSSRRSRNRGRRGGSGGGQGGRVLSVPSNGETLKGSDGFAQTYSNQPPTTGRRGRGTNALDKFSGNSHGNFEHKVDGENSSFRGMRRGYKGRGRVGPGSGEMQSQLQPQLPLKQFTHSQHSQHLAQAQQLS